MVLGIDPGFTGAIAFLNDEGTLKVFDMPLMKIQNKKQVDPYKFQRLLGEVACIEFAIIEDVHSMPNQGVASTFRFGYNAGILLGVLTALRIEVLRVKPSVWKSSLGLSRNKKQSLELAKKNFPNYSEYFKRAKDDGRAEAALLAYYGREVFCSTRNRGIFSSLEL